MLRLVHLAPPGQGPRTPGRRRVPCLSLTPDEKRHFRAALQNLRRAFGSWACLADAMGVQEKSLSHAARQGWMARHLQPEEAGMTSYCRMVMRVPVTLPETIQTISERLFNETRIEYSYATIVRGLIALGVNQVTAAEHYAVLSSPGRSGAHGGAGARLSFMISIQHHRIRISRQDPQRPRRRAPLVHPRSIKISVKSGITVRRGSTHGRALRSAWRAWREIRARLVHHGDHETRARAYALTCARTMIQARPPLSEGSSPRGASTGMSVSQADFAAYPRETPLENGETRVRDGYLFPWERESEPDYEPTTTTDKGDPKPNP